MEDVGAFVVTGGDGARVLEPVDGSLDLVDRYDPATQRVDPGYPKPIAGNWPGLWGGRIDAGVVWPNGKAYFFRDREYMRYDIAADKVDAGYPLPIGSNWPGLPGRVR